MLNIKKTSENLAKKEIEQRSAWGRGVQLYALELLEDVEELQNWNIENNKPGKIENRHDLEKAALNGADNWQQFSFGGSSLIYNEEIARRLCCPSELKRCNYGERKPNSREEWLDCQARALFQAFNRLSKCAVYED